VPVILALTFVYQNQKGMFYVPVTCGISALIIFLNFPSIVIFLHSRPIYYDDLIMKNYEGEGYIYNEEFRKKYQKIFQWIISASSSIMVSFTVELWFFRDSMFNNQNTNQSTSDKAVNAFVVLGVIGGLLRMYYGAAMMLGKLLLTILKGLKKREQERLRQVTENRTLVELTSIGVTIAGEDDELILQRASSCNDMKSLTITGFKPTLMADIFNEN
jgi:hypothetical protein